VGAVHVRSSRFVHGAHGRGHTGQPAARSFSRMRSMTTCGRRSMSALTRTTTHPADSSRATRSAFQGRGNPAPTTSILSLLSCGDSAPPSTSSRAERSLAVPGTPRCESATALTASGDVRVALSSASTSGTASRSGRLRPMSNAVRAGPVSAIPSTVQTSSGARSQVCTTMPAGACRSARMISAGAATSSHFVPSTAAADVVASVAPVDGHAARARSRAVSSTSRARYTSR
jgi:hypothetical protein